MKKPFKRPPPPRTRPVKGPAAQVEFALKAADLANNKRKHQPFYEQLQPSNPAPEVVADKMKTARIAASHAGQPPPSQQTFHLQTRSGGTCRQDFRHDLAVDG